MREIIKENAEDEVEKFETKFKEFRVEGKRKSLNASETNYTERLPKTYYTKKENKEIEAMYMGSASEARKRHCSFSEQWSQSRYRRQRSFSRNRFEPRRRYEEYDNRSRYDKFKTPGRRGEPDRCDILQTQ